MLRDVRAWHGGTPNLSDATRSIPNLEFYAPWFREPMVPGISYTDYKKLSDHAQKLARFCVADSSEELITGATLRAPNPLPRELLCSIVNWAVRVLRSAPYALAR